MLGKEDLIGGVEYTGLDGTFLDLRHAIETGSKHDNQRDTHSGDDDRATTSLDTIQGNDDKLPEWGFENEGQNQKHFAENRSVE